MAVITEQPASWAAYRRNVPYGFSVISTKDALAQPAILSGARAFINRTVSSGKPIGYKEFSTVNGRKVLYVIEPHFHPPGGAVKPWGWHKGCTVYTLKPEESYWSFLFEGERASVHNVRQQPEALDARLKNGFKRYAIPTAIGVGSAVVFGPVAGVLVGGGLSMLKYALKSKPLSVPPKPEIHNAAVAAARR
jgi:hypothetical protein